MSERDFRSEMDKIVLLARLAADGPDPLELINTVNHATDFGPFIDPTAWMAGLPSLREQKALLDAYAEFRAAAIKLRQEVAQRTGRAMP